MLKDPETPLIVYPFLQWEGYLFFCCHSLSSKVYKPNVWRSWDPPYGLTLSALGGVFVFLMPLPSIKDVQAKCLKILRPPIWSNLPCLAFLCLSPDCTLPWIKDLQAKFLKILRPIYYLPLSAMGGVFVFLMPLPSIKNLQAQCLKILRSLIWSNPFRIGRGVCFPDATAYHQRSTRQQFKDPDTPLTVYTFLHREGSLIFHYCLIIIFVYFRHRTDLPTLTFCSFPLFLDAAAQNQRSLHTSCWKDP